MNNLVCEHCEADIYGCEHYPVNKQSPDLVGEISSLYGRMHEYDKIDAEREKLIMGYAVRLNNLERKFENLMMEWLRIVELYRMAGKA